MNDKQNKLAQLNEAIANIGLTKEQAITLLKTSQKNEKEIFEYVKHHFENECSYPNYNVEISSNIKIDLSVDSLDVVELISLLEEKYSIVISDKEAEKWDTVEDIVKTVCRLL